MKWFIPVWCVVFAFSGAVSAAEKPQPVKVGVLFNLTGGMAAIDTPAYNGARLAAKLINQMGGVLNGRPIHLVRMDTRSDTTEAYRAAEKLISQGVVAAIGYGDTNYVMAAAPLFQDKGIPFITSGATDPSLPKRVGKELFMVAFGDDDQGHAMAEFAYTTLKARRVAVWTDQSMDFTRALTNFFVEGFTKRGGRIISEDSFVHGTSDFTAQIKRLTAQEPRAEAVFISGIPDEAVPAVEQVRKAGIMIPILSGDGFDANLAQRLSGPEVADRIYFSTHAYRGDDRTEVTAFTQAYKTDYGHEPENAFAALGYDAVDLLAVALQEAGSTDPKALTAALSATRGFKGLTGEISYTRPSGVPVKPVAIVGILQGQYRVMETWRP